MRPEIEQELAHTLLVELLAYQFASPVRWIETQDVVLGEMMTERIVEVGPADTLGVMAKRTIAAKYQAHDAAKSLQRQILCYNKDAKEIYYDVDPVEDEPAPAAAGDAPAAAAPSGGAAPVAAAAPAPSAGPAASVPDAPVGALEIVRSLIAQKLKKPYTEVPLSKAIKDLVGGKQNRAPIESSETNKLQANLPFRTRFLVTWVRSSDLHQKSQKTSHSMSWELPCRLLSTASSANNLLPSLRD